MWSWQRARHQMASLRLRSRTLWHKRPSTWKFYHCHSSESRHPSMAKASVHIFSWLCFGHFWPLTPYSNHAWAVSKWEHLAHGYISDIIALAHSFVAKTLRILYSDNRTWCGLVSVLKEHLVKKYQDASDMTEFILQVERPRTPMTLNHCFNDNLEKWSVQAPRIFFSILPLMFISVARSVWERLWKGR